MLRHVGAEEVGIGEIVQRPVQGEKEHYQRADETCNVPTCRRETPQIHIKPAQKDEPCHHARV